MSWIDSGDGLTDDMKFIRGIFEKMPPLLKERNPRVAALVGFLFGGIGLGIYFRTFVDFALPFLFSFVALMILGPVIGDLGKGAWLIVGAIGSVYGYYRTITSNESLDTY